jgi:hypothetical protein
MRQFGALRKRSFRDSIAEDGDSMPQKPVLFCLIFFVSILNAHAQEVRPDSYEPDSRTSRVPIQEGTWISRTLHADDEDWFTFTPAAAGMLTAETAGDVDTLTALYDGVSMVAENDDGFDDDEDYNSRIEYYVEAGITYTMKVGGYDENEIGPYRFRVILAPITQERFEPNDTMAQAVPLELGDTFTGHFLSSDDTDWYILRIPAAGALLLYTTGFTDTVLAVYDNDGNLYAEDDDGGDGGNARVHAEVLQGTLYIKVSEYDGNRGRYYLHTQFTE